MALTKIFIRKNRYFHFNCLSVLILFAIISTIFVYYFSDFIFFRKISLKSECINDVSEKVCFSQQIL